VPRRRVTLFALWVVFAVASVSVGFGAASLVSDPFTDQGTNAGVTDIADSDDGPVTEPGSSPTSSGSSPTSSPSSTKHHTISPTQSPAGSGGSGGGGGGGGTHSAGSTKSASPPAAPAAVKRGISTHGGYVSATCRGDLVSVAAAPAVWWQVDSMTPGQVRSARVRLEPSQDARGERVEVNATCSHGTPVFTSEYKPPGGGGGGDDSGGSGGSSGGSGGSDDSSGSGDG
jgi:hypothetical protein